MNFIKRFALIHLAMNACEARKKVNPEDLPLQFLNAWRNIPHSEKVEKGGEDAWYESTDLLVVADGVGGWADEGVDAGLYSRRLVSDIEKLFK